MTVLVSTLLQISVATHLAEKSFFPSCVCPLEHATSRHPSRCLTAHDAAAFMLARRNIITAHPHAPAFRLEHARQAITRTFRSKTLTSPHIHIQAFLPYAHHTLMLTSPSRARTHAISALVPTHARARQHPSRSRTDPGKKIVASWILAACLLTVHTHVPVHKR